MDLHACIEGDGVIGIPPGHRILIPTGLALEIEPGWEGQIRSRSGLALNHGIAVLNSPGTIDSDFRGEIKVILMNHGNTSFVVHHGDRIAQLVLTTIAQQTAVRLLVVEKLSSSNRGEGGFGSTGVDNSRKP